MLSTLFTCVILTADAGRPELTLDEARAYLEELGFFKRFQSAMETGNSDALEKDLLDSAERLQQPFFDHAAADMLFGLSPKQSFRLHERAFKAHPENADVAREMGLEYQRIGDCVRAQAVYATAAAGDPRLHQLAAICFVLAGKSHEAIEELRGQSPKGVPRKLMDAISGLDGLIVDVYGPTPAMFKRAQLRRALETKPDLRKALELLAFDFDMEADLDDDIARALKLLRGTDRATLEEISAADSITALPKTKLPKSSLAARVQLRWALINPDTNAEQLLEQYEKELWVRAKAGDSQALRCLDDLATKLQKGELSLEVARMGWQKLHAAEFAATALRAPGVTREQRQKAAKEFPDSRLVGEVTTDFGDDFSPASLDELMDAIRREVKDPRPFYPRAQMMSPRLLYLLSALGQQKP
jgi:hypothetical protein